MKYFKSFLMTLFIVLVFTLAVSADDAVLSVTSIDANSGDTISIDVKITGNPGFGGMAYDIIYDPEVLEIVKYETKLGADICTSSGIDIYPNKVNFQYAGTKNITGDGILVTFEFKALESSQSRQTKIEVVPQAGSFFYYDGRREVDFTVTASNGTVTVKGKLYGDVNEDGIVSVEDTVHLARYIAKWSSYSHISSELSDVYLDGKIDDLDLVTLQRYFANFKGYDTLPFSK